MKSSSTAQILETIRKGIAAVPTDSVDWTTDPALLRLLHIPTWKRLLLLIPLLLFLLQAFIFFGFHPTWSDYLHYRIFPVFRMRYYWMAVTYFGVICILVFILHLHLRVAKGKLTSIDLRSSLWLSGLKAECIFDGWARKLRRDLWAGAGVVTLMSAIQFAPYLFANLRTAMYCIWLLLTFSAMMALLINSTAYWGLARMSKKSWEIEWGPRTLAWSIIMTFELYFLPIALGYGLSFVANFGNALLHIVILGGLAVVFWINYKSTQYWKRRAESDFFDLEVLNRK